MKKEILLWGSWPGLCQQQLSALYPPSAVYCFVSAASEELHEHSEHNTHTHTRQKDIIIYITDHTFYRWEDIFIHWSLSRLTVSSVFNSDTRKSFIAVKIKQEKQFNITVALGNIKNLNVICGDDHIVKSLCF